MREDDIVSPFDQFLGDQCRGIWVILNAENCLFGSRGLFRTYEPAAKADETLGGAPGRIMDEVPLQLQKYWTVINHGGGFERAVMRDVT
jgi:hypothetical protein